MRVLVAAGGSGGHVYPALAVLEELQSMGELSAAAWVGTEKGIERKILSRLPWIDFYPLPCRGLQRSRPWSWPARAIHEQNAYMGLANRLLALLADRVFLSFPKTGGVPVRKKVLVTGNPVRRELSWVGPRGPGPWWRRPCVRLRPWPSWAGSASGCRWGTRLTPIGSRGASKKPD